MDGYCQMSLTIEIVGIGIPMPLMHAADYQAFTCSSQPLAGTASTQQAIQQAHKHTFNPLLSDGHASGTKTYLYKTDGRHPCNFSYRWQALWHC